MRIVAGTYRGRRLAAPRGRDVRPTSDRVREAAFALLGDVEGSIVLDLFAGTGAMGLEALSRGASRATFVEIDRQALAVVRRNIDATLADDRAIRVVKGDGPRTLRSFALTDDCFDLVIFDPPYERTEQLIRDTEGHLGRVLAPGGRVLLELATRHRGLAEQAAAGWQCRVAVERPYGSTTVAVLEHLGTDAPADHGDPDGRHDDVPDA